MTGYSLVDRVHSAWLLPRVPCLNLYTCLDDRIYRAWIHRMYSANCVVPRYTLVDSVRVCVCVVTTDILYGVQCTAYVVQCTAYVVQYTVYGELNTLRYTP